MKHPELASTFEAIAEGGHDGYYKGRIAQGQLTTSVSNIADGLAIVDLVQSQGGVMTLEDLAQCQAEVIQPIKYEYKAKEGQDGVCLWEVSSTVNLMMRY